MDRLEAVALARRSDHCLGPAEAFSLVGDETRMTILEALWHAEDTPVQFSTLYELSETDTSARFNYHLNQLTGHFVRKRDGGYELRTAGENVVRAVVAGSFNAHPAPESFETGDPCTRCGETLVASYADEQLAIDCPACGRAHGEYGFPPGGLLGRDDSEVLAAFDRRVRHRHSLARDGVCPACSGRIRTTIARAGECCLDADLRVEYSCVQCLHSFCSPIGVALLDQPALVAFHRDHGIDLRATPYWRLGWCVTDDHLTVDSTDPWRITLTVTLGSDTLSVTLDEALGIVESDPDDALTGPPLASGSAERRG